MVNLSSFPNSPTGPAGEHLILTLMLTDPNLVLLETSISTPTPISDLRLLE